MLERGPPDAPVEVRLVERRAADGREDELVGRVEVAFDCACGQLAERGVDGGEERHRAHARIGLRLSELAPGVGAFDADQAVVAVDVAPAECAELAEPEAGAERDVEETDGKEIRFVSERVVRCELDERRADRVGVLERDLLAGEVLGRREVGVRGRVGDELALPDGVGEHLAQRRDDVADRARRFAVGLERGDQPVDVLGAERGERPLAEVRRDVDEQRAAVLREGGR